MADGQHNPSVQGGEKSPLHRTLHAICTVLAGLGGLIIFGTALTVTLSVLASNIGIGGLRGEFELVELACAACASLFLPFCQLKRGHVMVDVFTSRLPGTTNRATDAVWYLVFAFAWAFVCWRLTHGLVDIHGYGDRTMMLRAPIWWIYIPAIIGTGTSAVVAAIWGLSHFFPRIFRMEGWS